MAVPPNPDVDLEKLTASIQDVASKEFDYVIVGGGTCGLVLAARLTEDPEVSVAVLETGNDTHKEPIIFQSGRYFHALADPSVMHYYQTTPQTGLGGRPMNWERGKGLGGSSTVNLYFWQNPNKQDVDDWEKLGASGWNWDRYMAGVKKAEKFVPPSEEDVKAYELSYDSKSHGTNGVVETSFSRVHASGQSIVWDTWKKMGMPLQKDPYGGNLSGMGNFLATVDPKAWTRSTAATGYFIPNAKRPNLKVLTGAEVKKVLFKEGSQPLEATGVEFVFEDGKTYTVSAKQEVILAAGTIRSSALLELSGIGNPEIIEPLGIKTKYANKAVGENVQEHLFLIYGFVVDTKAHPEMKTLDWGDPANAQEMMMQYAQGLGIMTSSFNHAAFLPLQDVSPRAAEIIAAEEKYIEEISSTLDPLTKKQYELVLQKYKDPKIANTEFVYAPVHPPVGGEPGKKYAGVGIGFNHPFSKGSIHIQSADHTVPTVNEANIFKHNIDLEVCVEMIKYARKMTTFEPLKNMVERENVPGADATSDDAIKEFIKKTVISTWHTIGTASALPEEIGGVVDPRSLKVYGTSNLRVGDLSIAPLHTCQHMQAMAYSIAENLADVIKAGA